jgi:hypothetical protein
MTKISDRLTIEEHHGTKIIFVKYHGLKEAEMIELVTKHEQLTHETKLPFIADFHNCYVTSGYMVYAKKYIESIKDIIDKGALVGVDPIKAAILKGVVFVYGVNYKAFETVAEAIDFLTLPEKA